MGRDSFPLPVLPFVARTAGPTSLEFRATGDRWSSEDDLPHSK